MNIKPGERALITTNEWFYAPDGAAYRGVHGTVKAVLTDIESLGVKTNARSTNWYVEIGCMTVAGCQIHYAVKCEKCNFGDADDWSKAEDGVVQRHKRPSAIFDADA